MTLNKHTVYGKAELMQTYAPHITTGYNHIGEQVEEKLCLFMFVLMYVLIFNVKKFLSLMETSISTVTLLLSLP